MSFIFQLTLTADSVCQMKNKKADNFTKTKCVNEICFLNTTSNDEYNDTGKQLPQVT